MDRVCKKVDSSLQKPILTIIFLCDCSGSMAGSRIAGVNSSIARVLIELKVRALQHPQLDWQFGLLSFANSATWHVAPQPLATVAWQPLVDTSGLTNLGSAYTLLADYLGKLAAEMRQKLPPILVLLSDGMPTDDVSIALAALANQDLAQHALRFAIGIGQEAELSMLQSWVEPWSKHKTQIRTEQFATLMALTDSAVELHDTLQAFSLEAVSNLLAEFKHG